MAEKGLSPRQKMINLMYLVLTALLALNVSAEVLNAFIVIDKSIKKSTENIKHKNDVVYSFFEKAYKENPKKYEKYYNNAHELSKRVYELDTLIQKYKWDLVIAADGAEGNIEDVKKKDDNNVGGEIMILKGGGKNLKNKINDFREFALGIIDDPAKSQILVENIKTTFNTDDIVSANNPKEKVPWEVANFEHLPLIAVMAILSKLQNDIHNVEADLLTYMQQQVDLSSWKFNKIQAIVNAPYSFVKVGEEFKAEIFIAAYDTTTTPVIVMKNGTKLPVENGKGIYKGPTGTPGKFDFAGTIKLKSPAGDTIDFPFQSSYEVVAPTFAISPIKMNVFYVGVDNPVAITATGKNIDATISGAGGTITKTGPGKFNVRVKQPGKCTITVIADGKPAGSMEFRCKPLPDPYATVLGKRGGSITKAELLAATFVKAQIDNFDFDVNYQIKSFTVSVVVGGYTYEESSNSASITAGQKNLIQQLQKGTKVYFENIKAVGPDGVERTLGTIFFKIM